MKNIFNAIFVLCISFVMLSCSNDNDDLTTKTDDIYSYSIFDIGINAKTSSDNETRTVVSYDEGNCLKTRWISYDKIDICGFFYDKSNNTFGRKTIPFSYLKSTDGNENRDCIFSCSSQYKQIFITDIYPLIGIYKGTVCPNSIICEDKYTSPFKAEVQSLDGQNGSVECLKDYDMMIGTRNINSNDFINDGIVIEFGHVFSVIRIYLKGNVEIDKTCDKLEFTDSDEKTILPQKNVIVKIEKPWCENFSNVKYDSIHYAKSWTATKFNTDKNGTFVDMMVVPFSEFSGNISVKLIGKDKIIKGNGTITYKNMSISRSKVKCYSVNLNKQ